MLGNACVCLKKRSFTSSSAALQLFLCAVKKISWENACRATGFRLKRKGDIHAIGLFGQL